MAVTTRNTYTGNGAITDFTISFSYIDRAHVFVLVDGYVSTDYTFFNSTTIRFNTPPPLGAAIELFRDTPDETILADFTPASALREQDLELDFNQLLNVVQELKTYKDINVDSIAVTQLVASNAQATATAALEAANTALSNPAQTASRVITSFTTPPLAQYGVADFTMDLGKLAELIAIQVSEPSWVRIYRSDAQRSSDYRSTAGGNLQAIIDMGDNKPYSENVTTVASQTIIQNPTPLLQGDSNGLVYVRLIKQSTGTSVVTFTTTTHPEER
jgi:hypothetical protein